MRLGHGGSGLPIGLTGPLAGGKSTVLGMLAQMGLRTASSDVVAREVFHEPEVQAAFAKRLGKPLPVLPAALREAMLQDPSLRRWTNRLMHPRIGARMANFDADVFEVPLLFEACLQHRYREVWTVTCAPQERTRRIQERYGPEASLERYEAWQLPDAVKTALSDVIVRTDEPLENVLRTVRTEAARSFPGHIADRG